jgi:hypothetical protein
MILNDLGCRDTEGLNTLTAGGLIDFKFLFGLGTQKGFMP